MGAGGVSSSVGSSGPAGLRGGLCGGLRGGLRVGLLVVGVTGCATTVPGTGPGTGTDRGPDGSADAAAQAAAPATPFQPSERAVRQRAPVEGGELSYVDLGHGPALVLLHAGNVDLRLWDDDVVPLLDAGYRVIRYDLRGAGRSTLPAGPFQHQDDLRLLLDHLGLPAATLVGSGLGGRVALDFAVEHAERVRALVLLAPGLSGFDWSTQDMRWFEPIYAAMVVAADPDLAARLWLQSPYLAPAMGDPVLAERLERLALNNSFQWTPRVHELPVAPPASERLAGISVPTLLLLGSRDDPGRRAIADTLQAGLAGLQRIDIIGAGHVLNLERPAEVHEALRLFLERSAPAR